MTLTMAQPVRDGDDWVIRANRQQRRRKRLRSLYEKHKAARRTPISRDDLGTLAQPVRDGDDWVIRANGVEIRNSIRRAALRDYATINNYRIVA